MTQFIRWIPRIVVALVFFSEISTFGSSTRHDARVTDLIAFGDSLSDSGNALHEGEDTSLGYIYPSKRFSDGYVWLDYLAADLGLKLLPSRRGGHNYAFAGAESGDGTLLVPGVRAQVTQYLRKVKGKADPDALYVIWVGGNDIKNRIIPFDLLSNVEEAVRRLAKAGARKFLIPNLPSLGQTPAFGWLSAGVNLAVNYFVSQTEQGQFRIETYLRPIVDSAIGEYNAELNRRLNDLAARLKVDILHPDIAMLLAEVSSKPETYGLQDQGDVFCHDTFHPSTKAHRVVASTIQQLLR